MFPITTVDKNEQIRLNVIYGMGDYTATINDIKIYEFGTVCEQFA